MIPASAGYSVVIILRSLAKAGMEPWAVAVTAVVLIAGVIAVAVFWDDIKAWARPHWDDVLAWLWVGHRREYLGVGIAALVLLFYLATVVAENETFSVHGDCRRRVDDYIEAHGGGDAHLLIAQCVRRETRRRLYER
jgi:hypothetical protein